MNARPLVLVLPLLACATAKPVPPYPLEDFQALERQQGWQELLGKLKEVAPSKRDATWEGFAERTAAAVLEAIEVKEGYGAEAAIVEADELMKQYPHLKSSKSFLEARAKVGIKAFKLSFSNYRHAGYGDEWLTKIRDFVAKDTVTPDLPLRLAKEAVLKRLVATQAFPLYLMAFERSSTAVCADGELAGIINAVLESGSWLEEVGTLVTKTCWEQLKTPVLERLAKRDDKHYLKHTCAVLANHPPAADAVKSACGK
jgi:hypothetical protein